MPRRKHEAARRARRAVAPITEQLAALRKMTVGELRERYREIFGVPTRSRNKDYLRKKIAWRIQELEEGGLSERALARIEELTRGNGEDVLPGNGHTARPEPERARRPRDPRLPEPGTVLRREHRGAVHEVTVLEDGFLYNGQHYRSLSQVARTITGTRWNGFLFFGLSRRGSRDGETG